MPKPNLSQLQKRLMSGFILGPLVVLVIIYGGWPFAVMVAGFAAIALYEWVQLSLKIKNKIPYLVLGIPYVLFCFWCMYSIRVFLIYPDYTALLFIAMIWASDIGAYIVGKKIGGPKMAPKISPNKTWAGFAGAVFFSGFMVALSIFYHALHSYRNLHGEAVGNLLGLLLFVFILGSIVGAFAQLGDLVVSFVKRQANVKDTGELIPGHGGLLDRVDSMMLAAVVYYAFVDIFVTEMYIN